MTLISRLTLNLRHYLDLTKSVDDADLAVGEISWWGPHFRSSSVDDYAELGELEQAPIELVPLDSYEDDPELDPRRAWIIDR